MANTTQTLAVIKKTNTEVTELQERLELVYKDLSRIGGSTSGFAKVSQAVKQTGSQTEVAVIQLNSLNKEMKQAAEKTREYTDVFQGMGEALPTVGSLCEKVWTSVGNICKNLWNSMGTACEKLGDSMETTMETLETFNYYKNILGNIANEWSGDFEKYGYENAEAYASSFTDRMNDTIAQLSGMEFDDKNLRLTSSGVKNLGLNYQEVTKHAAQFARVANSVGLSGENTIAASSAFSKLAGDLSSLYNIDYSTISEALQSGLVGQTGALKKYGIELTEATLQTTAYGLGIEGSISGMSQAEQMQLRMIAILNQSRDAWGNLANGINQPSNQIMVFKNIISELTQTLGQIFMPVLQKIMPFINGIAIAVKKLIANIAGILGIELKFNAQGTNEVEDSYNGISDSLDGVTESAKSAKTHMLGIDELNVAEPQTESRSSGGALGGIDLIDEILKATEEYQKLWDEGYAAMENRAQAFADKLSVVFKPIEQLFRDIKIGDWFAVGEDTSNIVSGIFNLFSNAIANVDWYNVGNNIGLFLAGIDWSGIFSSLGRFIWEGISSSIEMWVGSFNVAPFETAFLTILALPGIVGFGSKLTKFITSPFKQAFDLLPISSQMAEMSALWSGGAGSLGQAFMDVFGTGGVITVALAGLTVGLKWVYDKNEEVRSSFGQATESVSKGFQPLMEVITNDIIPDLQSGWDLLVETISPFTEFLESTFVSIWQDMINPALTYLGQTILPLLTTSLNMLWNDVFVPFGEFVSSFFMPIIEWLSAGLMVLWENIVIPLADALANILGKALEGIVETINVLVIPIIDAVIDIFQILWTEILEPVATWLVDTFAPIFETVFVIIGNLIDDLSQTFGGLLDFIFGVFTLDWKKAWVGIKDVFKGVFNTILSVFEGAANLIIDGINIILSAINLITEEVGDVLGINLTIPLIQHFEIQRFAIGGFPEDGLFFANHTELVGKFENGRTAVANNEQIISGIEGGVERAVTRVLAPYLADIAQNTRETANKDLSVNIGDREIARANRRGQKSLGYQLITE